MIERAVPSLPGALRAGLLVPVVLAAALGACSDDQGGAGSTTSTTVLADQTVTTVAAGAPPGAELEGLRELEVGQCFDPVEQADAAEAAVYLLDCADPHTYEVYDVVDYEGDGAGRGTSYPGTATVQNWSEQACYDRFEAFVGKRWTLSELDIQVWWPSDQSWALADRSVICTVVSSTGDPLTGTQRASAR
ncbi:MAG: septum formation family protein [Microthrixaceae bacterium]